MPFAQADDDGTIDVALIIALIVTDPAAQLVLLRTLFGQLQHPEFITALLTAPRTNWAKCLPSGFSLRPPDHNKNRI